MPKYKVLQGFEWQGQNREFDTHLEMDESEATPLIDNGLIALIEEDGDQANASGEVLGTDENGQQVQEDTTANEAGADTSEANASGEGQEGQPAL